MTVKTRDYSLDLLKIIAICMVCSYHYITYGILSQILKVIIFVVVGTLIGSLMKKIPIVKYLSQ